MGESSSNGSKDFLRFLTGQDRLGHICAEVSQQKTSLEGLFDEAYKKGHASIQTLDQLPEDEFIRYKYARPPGYCAQTILHMGKLGVMSLLDYGATCSGMPEEVAIGIVSHALQQTDKGAYSKNDDCYPFVSLFKYEVAPTVDGIAAGRPIEIRYAVTIRCEFVPVGEARGPFRNLYFKIFPKGTCNIPGCIIGFPVLDSAPYGLGHRVYHTVHGFEELQVSLPRLELGRRNEYTAALTKYMRVPVLWDGRSAVLAGPGGG